VKLSIPEHILKIQPYSPGKPIEALEREYGIEKAIKLASNENPLGPSPKAIEAIRETLDNLNRYPDGSGYVLIRKISEKLGVLPGNIVLGNGSDEIIGMMAAALLNSHDEAVMTQPSFLMYDIMVRSRGATSVSVPLKALSADLDAMANRITPRTRMVFLNNPNNPTGTSISKAEFKNFMERVPPGIVVVLDEAYIEFVRDDDCAFGLDYFSDETPLVILRTFSKAYGLAGLRIGYGIAPEDISSLINRIRPPFNTNLLAQIGAAAALDDENFLNKTVRLVHDELDFFHDVFEKKGIKYFPTQTNFFLVDVQKNADDVFEKLLRQGVIVRSMSSYGYPKYIRVNVGRHEENVRFIEALENVIKS
jgi:histidinol-phosphate aminotransferase